MAKGLRELLWLFLRGWRGREGEEWNGVGRESSRVYVMMLLSLLLLLSGPLHTRGGGWGGFRSASRVRPWEGLECEVVGKEGRKGRGKHPSEAASCVCLLRT